MPVPDRQLHAPRRGPSHAAFLAVIAALQLNGVTLAAQDPPRTALAIGRALAEVLQSDVVSERVEDGTVRIELEPAACQNLEEQLSPGTSLGGGYAVSGRGRDVASGTLLVGVADSSGTLWAVTVDTELCALAVGDDEHLVIRESAGWPLPAMHPIGSTPVELPW